MRENQMWFGTIPGRMRWIPAPNSGAEGSAAAWGNDDTFLNGEGYVRHSWNSHMQYIYEWPSSSSVQAAQVLKSYRDGAFGRGFLYFVEPNTFVNNVLPARWAAPSMAVGYEGGTHVTGVEPTATPVSSGALNDLPVNAAYYDLTDISEGWRGDLEDSVLVPIPEGHTLHLGAIYEATGSGAVYATPVTADGALGTPVVLTQVDNVASQIVADTFSNVAAVRIWFGKDSAGAASLTVVAITGRLIKTAATPSSSFLSGPWVGGMGHSGCRFVGVPTKVSISAVDGGQVQYACTLKESRS